MTTCAVCQAKTDANLCKPCTAELERAIAELPADLRDLQLVATRQASGPLGLGHGRQWDGPFEEDSLGDAPWEFTPGAADQVWVLNNTVTTWVRHLCESRRATPPADGDGLLAWLLANLDAIRLDEAAAQIHEELTGLHDENDRWVVGRRGAEVFAGRCDAAEVTFVQADDGTLVPKAAICGTALYGNDSEADLRCEACGMRYKLAERLEARDRQIEDQLARPHQIATALTSDDWPLAPALLRKWIQRDAMAEPSPEGPSCEACSHRSCTLIRRPLILARGVDDEGHPLYRFGDVRRRLQLVQEQRGIRLSA